MKVGRISHIVVVFVAFLLALANTIVAKAEQNMMFDKANQLYHNKEYAEATRLYQQLLDDGYTDADLFYNTGNAYYRINKIGMAIWCYHKAIELRKDKKTTDNLLLAEKRIKDPITRIKDIFFIRWWKGFTQVFTSNEWALYGLSFFLIACIALILKKLFNLNWRMQILWKLGLPITIVCLLLASYQFYNEQFKYEAVIIRDTIDYKNKAPLSEGILVVYVGRGKKGLLVSLPNGSMAEIKPSDIKKI